MIRIYLLVEGQTEEAFVRELLVPHYARDELFFTPIIINTSPGHKGGVRTYARIKPQLLRLCKQDCSAFITTMFDLYALPNDFPGKLADNYPTRGSGLQKAQFLESQLAQDVNQVNFIPNLVVHEFEALLFANPEKFGEWTDDGTAMDRLRVVVKKVNSPEDINDGPATAPSKRILKAMPTYQKTFHGPLIACDIGLDVMRAVCPHFDSWLRKLEALIHASQEAK
jgi:hypothetical protein